ncbi:MAG: sterol desaturase family protein [Deltaproteobacteria bacterium]|nr:sterol desaturase family protein [Deltaproteobacteria bacterium]
MTPLKEQAREWLGPLYEPLRAYFWSVASIQQRISVFWLFTAILTATALYLYRDRKAHPFTWRGLRAYLFPIHVFAHPSAVGDYKLFVVNKAVFLFGLGALAVSADSVQAYVHTLLRDELGAAPWTVSAGMGVHLAFALASLLAYEVGYFWAHYLGHKVPVLWEFHKLHHSAEVLTPFTSYREHPVDILIQFSVQGTLMGAVAAGFTWAFPGAEVATVWGINVVYLPFHWIANLRHSHIWLAFGPRLSRVLSSPAQHQIHHSSAPQHRDVNFANMFAFLDHFAGTLYVAPKDPEPIVLGIGAVTQPFPSLTKMYLAPFAGAAGRIVQWYAKPQGGGDVADDA